MLRLREWKVSPTLISGSGAYTNTIQINGKLFLNDNNDVLISDPLQDNILVFQEDEFDQRWENQDLTLTITPIIQAVISSQPAVVTFLIDEIRMFGGDASVTFPTGVGIGEYAGWYLCNGQNTPNGTVYDLRSKFIAGYDPTGGADYDEQGKGAGEDFVELTGAESGTSAHGHSKGTLNITASGSHTHYSRATRAISDGGSDFKVGMVDHSDDGDGGRYAMTSSASTSYNGSHIHHNTYFAGAPGDSSEANADNSHENRPEFIAVAFIQYKGV
jgi:hypothetical protein